MEMEGVRISLKNIEISCMLVGCIKSAFVNRDILVLLSCSLTS